MNSKIFENGSMVELAPAVIEAASGGVIPMAAVGVAFFKGLA